MSGLRAERLFGRIASEVEMVVSALSPMPGERTVWLDPYGRLWHGAPELGLPHHRWRAVGTFFRPSQDAVTAAVLAVLGGGREDAIAPREVPVASSRAQPDHFARF
jgi:hypothetical protein